MLQVKKSNVEFHSENKEFDDSETRDPRKASLTVDVDKPAAPGPTRARDPAGPETQQGQRPSNTRAPPGPTGPHRAPPGLTGLQQDGLSLNIGHGRGRIVKTGTQRRQLGVLAD